MASPHVAGAAALYLEGNPGATPSAVTQALLGNATTGKVTNRGSGSPNLLLSTAFIGGGPPGPNQPPVAEFSFTCPVKPGQCAFDATASTDDHGIVVWAWDFGDGKTGTLPVQKHTFPTMGTYDVTLTVTDGSGLSNSITQAVNVAGGTANQPPQASFTVSCTALACDVDGSGSTDDHGVTSWNWAFGDGGTGSGVQASHTYGAGGTYTITLTVRDASNLSGSASHTVTVSAPGGNQPPSVAFSTACPLRPHQCGFDASASSDDGTITTWAWDFGDGETGTRAVQKHTYDAPGTYQVTLTLTDDQGASASLTKAVVVP
jgi:PKD repeat protein